MPMDASRGQHDDGSQDEQLDNNRPGSSEFVRHYSRGTDALSVASVAAEAVHESHKQHLGLAALVCLIFLEVCGGPFGSEESVKNGGPFYAILGFIVLPLIWSVPEALVTAELATAFPENSGYVVWVGTAFGPFFGFMEGLFSWVSGVTDNTIYPVVFLSYLKLFVPALQDWWTNRIAMVIASIAMTALNYRGLDIVGQSSELIVVLILLPFIVLILLGIPHVDPSNWFVRVPIKDVDWSDFLNVMFWNLNYWDSVSTLAGEVREPGKKFPRALGIGVVLVVCTYLIPLMIGVGVTGNTEGSWDLGYYGHVAEVLGGSWLAWAMVLSAAVSQIGQFEAEMSSDSYQVLGMAERGYLPRVFAMRSNFGTPVIGIMLSSIGIVTMLMFDFMQIVELLNAVYCLAELMEFAAFIKLRWKHPDLKRVYKVPLNTLGAILMLTPASLLLLTVLALPIIHQKWNVVFYTLGVILLGLFLYPLLQVARRLRWVEFEKSDLDDERWSAAGIAVSMVQLPMLLLFVALSLLTGLDVMGVAAIVGTFGVALGICSWLGLESLLAERVGGGSPYGRRGGGGGGGSEDDTQPFLDSIPEGLREINIPEASATFFQAYLEDSVGVAGSAVKHSNS